MAACAGRVSVLFIDFDGLKAVNEAIGYETGDAATGPLDPSSARSPMPTTFPGAWAEMGS